MSRQRARGWDKHAQMKRYLFCGSHKLELQYSRVEAVEHFHVQCELSRFFPEFSKRIPLRKTCPGHYSGSAREQCPGIL